MPSSTPPATFESRDPTTGRLLATYPAHDATEVEAIVARAKRTFDAHRRRNHDERAAILRSIADEMAARRRDLADLATSEMGKRTSEALAEVDKCTWVLRHYADHAAGYLADRPAEADTGESFVAFAPLGPILAVMPWNFPYWQVFRCAAAALAAGNTCILKHASNVPGCAQAIADVVAAAAGPGLLEVVRVGAHRVADLVDDPRIRGVALTGSTPAGRAVAQAAGAALKKTVLELGGSDPYVVLADADLESAARICVAARFQNCGQSCIAAKRFVVVEEVADAFVERVAERIAALRMGDPRDPATDIGPMARVDLRDALHAQVERAIAGGAKRILGGTRPDGPGAFYPPTLLDHVAPGNCAHDEELFGPVAVVARAATESEAVALANATEFGLGAAVFSRDVARARRIARDEIHAGACFVNDFVRSDPRLPFGGIKDSGYGRELSDFGIWEFVNVKAIHVAAP